MSVSQLRRQEDVNYSAPPVMGTFQAKRITTRAITTSPKGTGANSAENMEKFWEQGLESVSR